MAKKTTRELVGDFIDLECQLEHANEEESLVLTSALEVTKKDIGRKMDGICLLYTSPSPRDRG